MVNLLGRIERAHGGRRMAEHLTLGGFAPADRHALARPTGHHALGTRGVFILFVHRALQQKLHQQSGAIVGVLPLGNL